MSRRQLQDALGLKGEENFRKLYLEPAMKADLVEMTIPDKPNSRPASPKKGVNIYELIDDKKGRCFGMEIDGDRDPKNSEKCQGKYFEPR